MVKDKVIYRKCNACDDYSLIAKYIYLTDNYIYPCISDSPNDEFFIKLITKCLKDKTNVFSLDNIFVALIDDKIVGVLCALCCGKDLTFIENLNLTNEEKLRVSTVNEGYFIPLIEESKQFSGFNVTNVCVDDCYRGRGIGKGLLEFYLKSVEHETVHLDVIADNLSAVNLYKKCGFEISGEYYGFSGSEKLLPCYHMIKNN